MYLYKQHKLTPSYTVHSEAFIIFISFPELLCIYNIYANMGYCMTYGYDTTVKDIVMGIESKVKDR